MNLFNLNKWYNLHSLLDESLVETNKNQVVEMNLETLDTLILELSVVKTSRLNKKNKKGERELFYFPSQKPYSETLSFDLTVQENTEIDVVKAYLDESISIQQTVNKNSRNKLMNIQTNNYAYLDLLFELTKFDINPNLVTNYVVVLQGLNQTFISDIPYYYEEDEEHMSLNWTPLTNDIYNVLTSEDPEFDELNHFAELLVPYDKESLKQIHLAVYDVEDFKKS
jgi:hypothetical protein